MKATVICDGRGNAGTGARAACLQLPDGRWVDRAERLEPPHKLGAGTPVSPPGTQPPPGPGAPPPPLPTPHPPPRDTRLATPSAESPTSGRSWTERVNSRRGWTR